MRSTTSTSLALALTLAFAAPALAAGPQPGCYARDYSAEHLAKNPRQTVAQIRFWIMQGAQGTTGLITAHFANQGLALEEGFGGETLQQYVECRAESGGFRCYAECDAGSLTVTKSDAKGLTFSTSDLSIGDGSDCGGMGNLAEFIGRPTAYRLDAAPASACPK